MSLDFSKYEKLKEGNYYYKLGKVVNAVGLTIESAGPDAKLGDLCEMYPQDKNGSAVLAEVVGFKDKKTLLMPYEVGEGIGLGSMVKNIGEPFCVKVREDL